jgi:hypothetical protein
MIDYEKALRDLKQWRKRDDNDTFSRNETMDSIQTLHSIYEPAKKALEEMIKNQGKKDLPICTASVEYCNCPNCEFLRRG